MLQDYHILCYILTHRVEIDDCPRHARSRGRLLPRFICRASAELRHVTLSAIVIKLRNSLARNRVQLYLHCVDKQLAAELNGILHCMK